MICNDQELAVVQQQLALAEHALEALRQRVKNPRNLAVFSEGPVDQIAELKAEIENYQAVKRKAARAKKPSTAGKRKTVPKPQRT
jgi:hypothetical protein